MGHRTTNDAITYTLISVGTVSSCLNLLLIVANCRSMKDNLYCRLTFGIQLVNFVACISDYPIYSGYSCNVTGAIFYFCFMVASH